jgi:hypothetical protein
VSAARRPAAQLAAPCWEHRPPRTLGPCCRGPTVRQVVQHVAVLGQGAAVHAGDAPRRHQLRLGRPGGRAIQRRSCDCKGETTEGFAFAAACVLLRSTPMGEALLEAQPTRQSAGRPLQLHPHLCRSAAALPCKPARLQTSALPCREGRLSAAPLCRNPQARAGAASMPPWLRRRLLLWCPHLLKAALGPWHPMLCAHQLPLLSTRASHASWLGGH